MASGRSSKGPATVPGAGTNGLFTIDEERFRLEPEHLRIIQGMMAWPSDRREAILRAYGAKLRDRVPADVLADWHTLYTPEFGEAAGRALGSGDMVEYSRLIKGFAKGFAEARVPYYFMDTLARTYEETLLPFIVEAFPDPEALRRVLEARHRLLQVHAVLAAEAYYEVSHVTMAHLHEELGEALHRPDHLWWAFMETSAKLGLEKFEPRALAQALLDRIEYPGTLEEREGRFIYTGPHVLVNRCPGNPDSCLSGFLAEAKVERLRGEALRIEAIRILPGDLCEVTLVPLDLDGMAQA